MGILIIFIIVCVSLLVAQVYLCFIYLPKKEREKWQKAEAKRVAIQAKRQEQFYASSIIKRIMSEEIDKATIYKD